MAEFLTWFTAQIAEWWTFLVNTQVPGCSFSFATLFLFVLLFDIVCMVVHLVLQGNTQGGGHDVSNKLKGGK